jgi:hypothetical protein
MFRCERGLRSNKLLALHLADANEKLNRKLVDSIDFIRDNREIIQLNHLGEIPISGL